MGPRRWAALAAVALLAAGACSSAEAAVDPLAALSGLSGSSTLAAAADDRVAELCEDGGEPAPTDAVGETYDQETWAEVAELVGRAPLDEADDEDAAVRAIHASWRDDPALDGRWDHAATATASCPDGHLYGVTVLARTPRPEDAGAYARDRTDARDVVHEAGLRYGVAPAVDGRPVDLLLDVFRPAGAEGGPRPTLVLVHGGGFAGGSREQHAEEGVAYARRGFVVATIDYRLDPDAGESRRQLWAAGFAGVDDAMEAVRWLRSHADELGIDPERIAALGASAGGQIALALALLEDPTPGGSLEDVSPEVAAAFSTGSYVTPVNGVWSIDEDDAPVLLQHFEHDTVTDRPWTYAAATCDAVRAAGATCDLDVSAGEDHTVGLGPESVAADRILAFLAVHLQLA